MNLWSLNKRLIKILSFRINLEKSLSEIFLTILDSSKSRCCCFSSLSNDDGIMSCTMRSMICNHIHQSVFESVIFTSITDNFHLACVTVKFWFQKASQDNKGAITLFYFYEGVTFRRKNIQDQ